MMYRLNAQEGCSVHWVFEWLPLSVVRDPSDGVLYYWWKSNPMTGNPFRY